MQQTYSVMKNYNLKMSIILGLLAANMAFAFNPKTEKDDLVIGSITYIEEDEDFDIDFDTADYLPEDFDPYKIYFDLTSIVYVEADTTAEFDFESHLPKNFDAYAYPTDIKAFNYIDENDEVKLDFDTKKHLPDGFDPYIRNN
jgi:hypothetical protein